MIRFAPLHIYSAYSFLESGLTMERIERSIIKNNYFGAAITDKGVMFGIPEFVYMMEKIKRPFIVGLEVKLSENTYCLYAFNEEGYLNLSYISSTIQKEEFDLNVLTSHLEGVVCVLDTSNGEIKDKLLAVEEDELSFARYLNELSKPFKYFYLGLEIKERNELNYARRLRKFAKEHEYQIVAFPHIKYQNKDDAIVLKIVNSISNDERITEKSESGNQFFMTLEDYQRIYTSSELENTVKIVSMSTFNYHQKRGEMLHFLNDKNAKDYLRDQCFDALKDKGLEENNEYVHRLNYELDVISSMGYDDYFLLVQDYVNWSRENDILVGVRGSAAGSLVTYLLGISTLDPIYYNLQFERFLNPSRKTMPDIDIDFMDIRRNEVVEYCRNKYGQDKVANIITYQSILAKQSLRDIGRIYDYPTRHIDLLCKLIPEPKSGQKYTLRMAYKNVPAFKELVDSDKYFLEIVTLASKIEGLVRQSSLHAAGVILNNNPIIDAMPVTYDLNDNLISQYEMTYLEEQGFLKMDFLGLNHLSVVSNCVDLINKRRDMSINKFNIPFNDDEIYKTISSLHTMGIFQLESSGMKNAIKVLKPSCLDDLAALLALFRPGPMNEIKTYARRKAGKEKVPEMSEGQKKILGPTYGIIVYQEQISELAVVMANMNMTDADNFRRAISKKKKELLSSMESAFVNGSINNGYSEKEARDYFNRIFKFAEYGFNKSHAYGYAQLSAQMAYLKTYYPLEFYVSLLQSGSSNDVKFSEYISEMKKRNIRVLPPNINYSGTNFEISDEAIIFPLNGIKGVSILNANKIIEVRKDKPFIDFIDFICRTYSLRLTETFLLNLINSGALDSLHPSRETMRVNLNSILKYAELMSDENGQMSLDIEITKPALNIVNDDELVNLEKEYDAIGIMLSNNPLAIRRDELAKQGIVSISEALELSDERSDIRVAGIIRNKKVITTKKSGTPMAFIKIFDETNELETIFFPETYKDAVQVLDKNKAIIVTGYFEKKGDEINFIAKEAKTLED